MSFTPAIPLTGYLGWRVFNQSAAQQLETYKSTASVIRDVDYFKANVGAATTAEALVNDRQLLKVALGAFGLEDEINKRAFIQKILESGTDDPQSFANKLTDPQWKEFAKAFGYGNAGGARVGLNFFKEEIADQYMARSFEARVGDVDTNIRLAMNFRREAVKIAEGENADTAGWFQIMGQKPLRAIVEAAFGLPAEFGKIDIDQQRSTLEQKAEKLFGSKSPAIFSDPEIVDQFIRQFFLRKEIEEGPSPTTRGMGAVTMLTSTPASSFQTINLLLSNS